MIDSKKLLTDLQSKTGSRTTMVKRLEDDLRARCDADPAVDAPLQAQYDAARQRKRTALTYKAWREEQLTQIAVAWVLGCVFVRFLEDNELVETPKLSGPGARLQRARDEHELFFHSLPQDNTDRGYLIQVFEETGRLPGMREFFDKKHNPLWLAAPSGDACRELLQFWQKTDPETGNLIHDFTQGEAISESPSSLSPSSLLPAPCFDTRFLGDLYQDLSEAARKKYALLQTPDFIESFILDRTLTPAIETFGYRAVRLIDPTCGSGHFLLGAFARLFRIWQDECPGENPRVLAQRALDGVYGVDLNPFAVAIARFRLLLAALQVSGPGPGGRLRLKDAPDFTIHLATGDALLHGRRFRQLEAETRRQSLFETDEEIFRDELKHHYEVEDTDALHRILGQQYHAVVGNPPYITVKDKAVSDLYRARYPSCAGKYSLSVPFMERFFDLAVKGDGSPQQPAGYTGQITANSFMKNEFGKKLIEEYIPRWDLTHVLDTAVAYIPGHGTPTVILFGKNQPPMNKTIRTVLGIRGEPATPSEPSQGLVWQAIARQVDEPSSVSEWVSAADSLRANFLKHPWSIGGGGAAELKACIDEACDKTVWHFVEIKRKKPNIGFASFTGLDEAFLTDRCSLLRASVETIFCRKLIKGDIVRDWAAEAEDAALVPCDAKFCVVQLVSDSGWGRYLWPNRTALRNVESFETTREEEGSAWWSWYRWIPSKYRQPRSITYGEVATHNHFVLDQGGKVFKQTAPVIKLEQGASDDDHMRMLGILNSSLACFWLKQVCKNKGSTIDQHGARQRTAAFEDFFAFNATKIAKVPIPAYRPSQLPTELVQGSTAFSGLSPSATLASWKGTGGDPLRTLLTNARLGWKAQRQYLIAWQEELDWQVYEAYGLIEAADQVSQAEGKAMDAIPPDGITLGQRAFEIVLARRMMGMTNDECGMTNGEEKTGFTTTWFTRHGSTPITEVPAHWPAAYRELVERRIARIESDANIRLIEQPEYKRRWNTESWEKSQQEALRQWLLLRLETYFHGSERMVQANDECRMTNAEDSSHQKSTIQNLSRQSVAATDPQSSISSAAGSSSPISNLQSPISSAKGSSSLISNFQSQISLSFPASARPHLVSANQLADVVQSDARFLEAAEVYVGAAGFSVPKLVRELVETESVPALPRDRYKDSGLRKRSDWEETWRLQRLEDAVEEEIRDRSDPTDPTDPTDQRTKVSEEELKKRIRKAQLEKVGEIPVPPKYAGTDFKKPGYWKLRGKLDVPKERWICYPGAERAGDDSPLIAWAGWDHLQQAQALAEYFIVAKDHQGWPADRLRPLLAALADLIPWLKQWHNAHDPAYGMGLGDYFAGFLEEQCRALGMTVQEVDAARFEASESPMGSPARKQAKKRRAGNEEP